MSDVKILYVVRGLPGSGKTTLANLIASPFVYSADDFFTDSEGNYNFDQSKIQQAHKHCQDSVAASMEAEMSHIAVANTFTQEWEMKPYFDLAEKHGYQVHSIIVENRHGNKDIHNVPTEVVNRMRDRFTVKLV